MKKLLAGIVVCTALCGFSEVERQLDAAHASSMTLDINFSSGTGYLPTGSSVFEMEFTIVDMSGGGTLFFTRGLNRYYNPPWLYSLTYTADGRWDYDYNYDTPAEGEPGTVKAGHRYKIVAKPEGLWVDGVQVCSRTPATFNVGKRLWLFDSHNSEHQHIGPYANVRIHSFKAYEPDPEKDGELVPKLDMTPCLQTDGKLVLYDKVNEVAFGGSSRLSPAITVPAPNGIGDCDALTNAFAEVARIFKANGNGRLPEILLQPGYYDVSPYAMDSGSHILVKGGCGLTFAGLGATRADTVLDGGGEAKGNGLRTVKMSYYDNYNGTTMRNMTIIGGNMTSADNGGGVWGNAGLESYCYVLDCIISNNYAKGSNGNGGGGAYGVYARNCLFAENWTSGSGGGARSCSVLSNCTFLANRAGSGGGASSGTLRDCYFEGNHASIGGGLHLGVAYHCTFVSNRTDVSSNVIRGGGQYQGSAYDCTFIGNFSSGEGGGTYGTANVRCKFIGNTGTNLGGGTSAGSSTDCFYTQNVVTGGYGGGGGAYGGVLTNCVFTANSDKKSASHYGAAVHNSTLVDCVITNETALRRIVCQSNLTRCRIADCKKSSSNDTYNFCLIGDYDNNGTHRKAVNCVIEDCACRNSKDRVARAATLVNCTIRNVTGLSNGALDTTCQNVVNTIVADCAPHDIGAANCPTMTNCVYRTVSGELTEEQAVGCWQVSNVKWAKDGPYLCDIRASSKAFNGGYWDDDIAALVGETDCAGRPRVMFGKIDIGALECQDDTLPGLMLLFR